MADFPQIKPGIITQRPYGESLHFLTAKNEIASGHRYAWSWRASALRRWTLEYPAISQLEAGTLELFFDTMQGRLTEFSFTCPRTGTVYPRCRFDQDTIEIRYIGPGHYATSLSVVEVR
jgi:hypothetical protein